jgi:hypothetical protein
MRDPLPFLSRLGFFFSRSKESLLAFTCGDIMLFITTGIPSQAISTIILAMLGGAAGMAGKDFYGWIKEKVKAKKKRKSPKTL